MNTYYKIVSVVAAVVFIVMTAGAAFGRSDSRKIVIFDEEHFNGAYADGVIAKHAGAKVDDLDFIRGKVVNISEKGAKELAKESGVLTVEDDAVVSIQVRDEKVGGGDSTAALAEVLPWGIARIHADQVWTTGNKADVVKVGVIDTGISSGHPDLKANIKGGVNYVRIRGRIDPNKWTDDNGHGSHVAGIIAGIDNLEGVIGAANAADLYAIKVLNSQGSGYISDIILGLGWAASSNMDVVNMSLGCDCNSVALHDAVINAYNAGVILVAAAGNSGGAVIYPAAYPEVIAVGATNSADAIASWSSHGPEVDVSAPGVSIYSTYKGTGYATLSGTSMASPHVAGAIALLLNTPVGSHDELVNGQWDFAEVKARLNATSQDLGSAGWDEYFGIGLVDALALTQ